MDLRTSGGSPAEAVGEGGMIDWEAFGRMIRKQREAQRKGIRELARELGMSPATVLRADRGEPVSTEIFMTFCEFFLDINPATLLK